ncbi:hypothetical protein TL16_g07091 [Triparma laevis f. inornata]|nr:hypothetical protein TL16_g07091 [Triparma laevis f. inornata]
MTSTDPLVTLITNLYSDSSVTGVKNLSGLGLTSRSKTIQRLISIRCGKPGTLKGSDSASNRMLCAVMLAVEEGIENSSTSTSTSTSNDTGLPINVLSQITIDKVSKAGGIRKKDFNDLLNKVRNYNVTQRPKSNTNNGETPNRRNSTGAISKTSHDDSWKRKSLRDLRASTSVKSKPTQTSSSDPPSSPTVTFNPSKMNAISANVGTELGTLTQTVLKKIQVTGVQLHQPVHVLNLSKKIYLSYAKKILGTNTQKARSGREDVERNVMVYALCCLRVGGAGKGECLGFLTKEKSKSVGER